MKDVVLIDIDGVLALEVEPPFAGGRELLRLHRDVTLGVTALGAPAVVLTHRSRREAEHILQTIGMDRSVLAGLVAAEDLLVASLRARRFGALFDGGLLKGFILPEIERRFGVARERMAFIDDKMANLKDLLAGGVGIAVHAPSAINEASAEIVSFEFSAFVRTIEDWRTGQIGGLVSLPNWAGPVEPWRRTGTNTARHGNHLFNHSRRLGAAARQVLRRVRTPAAPDRARP